MTGTLICDEDGLYDPRNFNDRLLLGMKGQISEAELHFIRARLRGGLLSKARRGELIMPLPVGLVYDAAGHVILDPDTAVQGAVAAPVRHLRRPPGRPPPCVKAFRAAGLSFPWRHQHRAPQGRAGLAAAAPPHRAAGAAQPPLRRRVHLRPAPRPASCPAARRVTTVLPREEWISFIPGAHPGYITLDQYEANLARLAANAAAHGRDRAAGPPREGPALLQGIIICGRCGAADDRPLPHPPRPADSPPTSASATASTTPARSAPPSPAPTLDEHVGQLLIDTLTPLAVEAALAGLRRARAPRRRGRRAARRPRRARPLPRRPGPPPLPRRRPRQPARRRHPRSRLEHRPARPRPTPRTPTTRPASSTPGSSPTPRRPGSASWSPTCPASGTTPPPPPRERKRIARLLLTDVTVHPRPATPSPRTSACAGGQHHTLTLPAPKPAWEHPPDPGRHHRRRSTSCSTTTPTPRSPASSTSAA